jgi:CheY-like chemotaxis protein
MPKILIADDSIAVRKVAERLLTEAGMVVSLAANGTEAMAFLGRECPDLVVSDVIMPDKSGYEVCSFVRAQPNLAAVPVLLISGIVNDEVTRQAECCHADGVLKKPFQGTSLKDLVQDLLSKHRDKAQAPAASPAASNGKFNVEATQQDRMPNPEERLPDHRKTEPEPAMPSAVAQQPVNPIPESSSAADRAALRARIVELEAALQDAGDRAYQIETKWKEAEPLIERAGELEKVLAEARREWEECERALRSSLLEEQARNQESSQRAEQLAASLVDEQRRAEELAARAAEVEPLSVRLAEMESTLATEREAAALLADNMSAEDARKGARISELEATLAAERDAATQLVQQITVLEKLEGRVKDLEARLSSEREQSAELRNRIVDLEQDSTRAKELDTALIAERERCAKFETALSSERQQAAILVQQVTELEQAVNRARELDTVLASERERSTQLAKRATEAEHLADQSNRRLEDMARKLAEIAGLASQLGQSAR